MIVTKLFGTVFIFSSGQSFTKRGFSVNKNVVDYNMEEKSLTSQRLLYDAIHNGNPKLIFKSYPH